MSDITDKILACIPHKPPFRFVDGISEISEVSATGYYTFREDEYFYKGHFPGNPVTPGVILTETLAQSGLLPLGIYLAGKDTEWQFADESQLPLFVLTSSDVEFLKGVLPGEHVVVSAEKVYFRLGKLKANLKMFNDAGQTVCRGILSGMVVKQNGKV
ncbi:MAG: hydroxymyristoyl-ACP dehydratase [Bacteroidia bacterium]